MISSSLVVTFPPIELLWLRHSPSGSNLYGAAHAKLTASTVGDSANIDMPRTMLRFQVKNMTSWL